jgi:UDP-glucuronate 4-epimerase
MKIIVTGTAGFIGSHLCEKLLDQGNEVIGIDNFDDYYDPQIKRKNIENCVKNNKFTLFEHDIRDFDKINKIFKDKNINAVVHLAAKAGVRPSIENPRLYTDVNINGTMILLEMAKKHTIEKFIFASSSSIYGNNRKTPFSESDIVDYPISPYAATKKSGELLCHTYHHLYNLPVTCLRFFTVYGPRQRPDLAIHKFTKLIDQKKPIPVYGDGTMSRDFTYMDDIVNGVLAAIENCQNYHIYNLGESKTITVKKMIETIENALGKKAIIDYQSEQPGDVKTTFADISKAKEELEYNPSTTFEQGINKFVEWFKKMYKNPNF